MDVKGIAIEMFRSLIPLTKIPLTTCLFAANDQDDTDYKDAHGKTQIEDSFATIRVKAFLETGRKRVTHSRMSPSRIPIPRGFQKRIACPLSARIPSV
jgi:hypothetical protein